ncbi:MAG: hypothetical protein Q8761_03195 [Sweet potato little leaf phytoplasma]|nr:hypothetical protein [Sweet potato little leaf phytoplasma]
MKDQLFNKNERSIIQQAEDTLTQPTVELATQQQTPGRFHPSGNYNRGRPSSRGRGNQGRGHGGFPSPGRGSRGNHSSNYQSSQSFEGRVPCQICNHSGHTVIDCYNRMNYHYQGRHPSTQLAVMVASHNVAYCNSSSSDSNSDSSNISNGTWISYKFINSIHN